MFEKTFKILTPGHTVVLSNLRIEKVQARAEYSNYLISPTKFAFEKVVRIYTIVWRYIKSHKCRQGKIQNSGCKFQMFPAIDVLRVVNMSFGCKDPGMKFRGDCHVLVTDDDVAKSLEYLFKKGAEEVKKFNKPEFVKRVSINRNGILYSKTRILDNQRFQEVGGLEDMQILDNFALKVFTPVLDRYSPLSYAIADYVHRSISKHKGYETCFRESLNYVFIIQAMSLFKEINDDCVKCTKLRRKYLDISMGPVADEQLQISPPFWVCLCDIYGPCKIYVPGHSMPTRNRDAVDVMCYVLVFVCPVTKLVNMQVIESKKAEGVVDGINRLGCEVGLPSFVLVDQDSGIMKALKEAEVNLKDLQYILYKEKGIKFKTCPVSGHNYHGAVERRIRSVQECLERCDVANMRLHATGYQTFIKLAENDINNLPMGYAFERDTDNSPILKLIFPNMLKIGRINRRALDGPVRLPKGPGELMKRVEKAYTAFYKLWNTSVIPKLMKLNKWYDSKAELQVDDLVYFKKEESELSSKWTVGKITEVVHSKDGQVRRATVQYQNAN